MQITETTIDGFAHCEDALCPGNHQAPVQVIATLVEQSGADKEAGQDPSWGTRSGALAKLVENSWTEYRFANEADRVCPACGRDRVCTEQKRPTYASTSGQRQDARLLISKYGSIEMGERIEAEERARKAEELAEATEQAVEREQAARKRLADAEAQLSQVAEPAAAAEASVGGTRPVAENGHAEAEDDPRVNAILSMYLAADESSVKAAEMLRGTEWATSDRTIRTLVSKHADKLEELRAND
jgi:hypothetical protein